MHGSSCCQMKKRLKESVLTTRVPASTMGNSIDAASLALQQNSFYCLAGSRKWCAYNGQVSLFYRSSDTTTMEVLRSVDNHFKAHLATEIFIVLGRPFDTAGASKISS